MSAPEKQRPAPRANAENRAGSASTTSYTTARHPMEAGNQLRLQISAGDFVASGSFLSGGCDD
jgi:hypothetical protein